MSMTPGDFLFTPEQRGKLIRAVHELCVAGYENPELKKQAMDLAKGVHSVVGAHYPDYRSWFEASAESYIIEMLFGVLMEAGYTWDDAALKALADFRQLRQEKRQKEENR